MLTKALARSCTTADFDFDLNDDSRKDRVKGNREKCMLAKVCTSVNVSDEVTEKRREKGKWEKGEEEGPC